MDFEQLSRITKDTCISYGVSLSDLDGVVNAVSDFATEHTEVKALDSGVMFVVLLAAAYKAGRESATVPHGEM